MYMKQMHQTLVQAKRTAGRGGFSLMELLVVVAIMVILASVAVPTYMWYRAKSQRDTAEAACKMYAKDIRSYIESGGQINQNTGWPATFSVIPTDPWGNAYQWQPVEVILSDGTPVTEIVVWTETPDGEIIASDPSLMGGGL